MLTCTPTPIPGYTARGPVFDLSFLPWMLATTANICTAQGTSTAGLLQDWRMR